MLEQLRERERQGGQERKREEAARERLLQERGHWGKEGEGRMRGKGNNVIRLVRHIC